MSEYDYQLNLKNLFPAALWEHPDQEIVYREISRYRLKEFYDRVGRLASALSEIGVKPGDKVAVLDWDTNRYLEAYYAIPMMGAILHTVNIRYPPELIFYTMQHAEDKYVIVSDEFLPLLEKTANLFSFIKGWVVHSDTNKDVKTSLYRSYGYEDLLKSQEPYDFPDLNENTTATIFYTSGTTGLPKGVTFTHRQLVLQASANALIGTKAPFHLNEKDVYMSLVPMFHVHSWTMPYFILLSGNKYVLPGRFDVKRILELVKKEHITYSFMVPSILYMILTHPEIESYAKYLDGWKVSVGGSALPKGLAQMAQKFGIYAIGGYGLSETCPVLTTSVFNRKVLDMKSEDERIDYRIGTGLPLPFVNLRVVGTNGKDVAWDNSSIGEIIVRAPWLTRGYYKDEEKTAELWRDGWLHTGDLSVVDSLGYLHIVDREKDAIKSGGEFIPSLLLEDVISLMPEAGEVAVVGKPDPKWGERPVVFLTRKGNLDAARVRSYLAEQVQSGRIQKWWAPDDIIFVDSMPKTSTNKIDKKELRKKL
ncbi:MAG: fatty acid--CoA ligase [Candidatus Thermoplasmatota archaeon]|jgi:fatty-acyl-CoA synthase|nr:fatty acid--CoA ligase [Candidatus Thermoplasmatota archaeon]MCL5881110.1 fatty acid--CoA ligase [Candidatus Thermoplasmatota archaeon]MCL5882239.1 fatty acid--CoA ligase [Candidatus Thermoplasmatota archaeon]